MHLPAIQHPSGVFSLFEFDQAPKIADLLGIDLSQPANVDRLQQLMTIMLEQLQSDLSGAVIDPIYSHHLLQHKSKQTGVLGRLTAVTAEVDPLVMPTLMPDWSVEDISQNYGLAKLCLYYHPQEEKALDKKQLVAELYDYCQYQHIDFALKLIIYTPASEEFSQESFQAAQLQAVQELRSTADLLILQYPLGPLAAATVTAELDIPWLLQSQNQEYDSFKHDLRICLENGAQGFCVSDSLWKDMGQLKLKDKSPDWEQIEEFIKTDFRDRLIEINRIAHEEVE